MEIAEIKKIKEIAENFDITKVPDKILEKIADTKSFEEAINQKDIGEYILGISFILGCAKKNKNSLTEKEFGEEAFNFYIELLLEYMVRKGMLERDGKWTYKTSNEVRYRETKKGEEEAIKILKEMVKKNLKSSSEKPNYIG